MPRLFGTEGLVDVALIKTPVSEGIYLKRRSITARLTVIVVSWLMAIRPFCGSVSLSLYFDDKP